MPLTALFPAPLKRFSFTFHVLLFFLVPRKENLQKENMSCSDTCDGLSFHKIPDFKKSVGFLVVSQLLTSFGFTCETFAELMVVMMECCDTLGLLWWALEAAFEHSPKTESMKLKKSILNRCFHVFSELHCTFSSFD